MTTYYLHLHECGVVHADASGRDFADLEQARIEAVDSARDMMSHEVRRGALCLSCCIVIEDTARAEVLRVQFRDALALSGI